METEAHAPTRMAGSNAALAFNERLFRRALALIAFAGLALGVVAWGFDRSDFSDWCWALGTAPSSWACSSP